MIILTSDVFMVHFFVNMARSVTDIAPHHHNLICIRDPGNQLSAEYKQCCPSVTIDRPEEHCKQKIGIHCDVNIFSYDMPQPIVSNAHITSKNKLIMHCKGFTSSDILWERIVFTLPPLSSALMEICGDLGKMPLKDKIANCA